VTHDAAGAAPIDSPVALDVQELRTRRYPGRSISMSVRKGEILGVAGLIGAGRSELAAAICGVEPRVSGRVLLEGAPLAIRSPRDAIAHGIYLVPEDRRRAGLVIGMRVRENISLPGLSRFARLGIVTRVKERAAAERVSRELQVKAPSIETTVANLSGGNQQKVVLAKWLSLAPRVLVFDEPTRGIDVGAKDEIYQLMRALAGRGVAILMISSDMEEILAVSHRVAVMHEGRVTGILDRAACTPEAIMQLAVA
jgi:ribose transport system ATP-binding protein